MVSIVPEIILLNEISLQNKLLHSTQTMQSFVQHKCRFLWKKNNDSQPQKNVLLVLNLFSEDFSPDEWLNFFFSVTQH